MGFPRGRGTGGFCLLPPLPGDFLPAALDASLSQRVLHRGSESPWVSQLPQPGLLLPRAGTLVAWVVFRFRELLGRRHQPRLLSREKLRAAFSSRGRSQNGFSKAQGRYRHSPLRRPLGSSCNRSWGGAGGNCLGYVERWNIIFGLKPGLREFLCPVPVGPVTSLSPLITA